MHRTSWFRLAIVALAIFGAVVGNVRSAIASTDDEHETILDGIWWQSFWGLLSEKQELDAYDFANKDHSAQRRAAGQLNSAQIGIDGRIGFVDGLGTDPFQLELLFVSNATDEGQILANQAPFYSLVQSVSYYYAPFPTSGTTGIHWVDNPAAGTFVGASNNPLNGFAVTTSLPAEAINQQLSGNGSAEAMYYGLITYFTPQPQIAFSSATASLNVAVPEPATAGLVAVGFILLALGRRVKTRRTRRCSRQRSV